jgi:hypothetical protein
MSFKGDIRVLFIKVDSLFVPVGCLTSNPISESVEMLSTVNTANGGWTTSIPTTQSFTIDFEGIQVVDETKLSYLGLKKIKRTRQRIEWRIADEAQLFIDEGFGYITQIGESNEAGGFLSFSGQIIGYGEPTIVELDGDLWQDGETMIFQDGTSFIY